MAGKQTQTPEELNRRKFLQLAATVDVSLNQIEAMVNQYRRMFDVCNVSVRTRQMIIGGTLTQMLVRPLIASVT